MYRLRKWCRYRDALNKDETNLADASQKMHLYEETSSTHALYSPELHIIINYPALWHRRDFPERYAASLDKNPSSSFYSLAFELPVSA